MPRAILRLAMWSGPRNISTALLRSFGNRPDTAVCDEPLYACYLAATDKDHPGADEIMRLGQTDWRQVVEQLSGAAPGGAAIFYQKHMAHHLLPGQDRAWLEKLQHAFLIRDPREMILSLLKKLGKIQLEDTGLPQQVELFEEVRARTGQIPPVIDAKDVLSDPRHVLQLLCARLGLKFSERMLSWPAGPRPWDGVWARYWYDNVRRSTGFQPYQPRTEPLPPTLLELHGQCQELYDQLHSQRLH